MNKQEFVFPQEIDSKYVLPSIRKTLAVELTNLGVSQKKVAEDLGLTEAAISQYKNNKRAKEISFDEKTVKEIKESAKKLKENPDRMFNEIMRINNFLKKTGRFCKIHKEISNTPSGCEEVCNEHFFTKNMNDKVLEEMSK